MIRIVESVRVADSSSVGAARRAATLFAESLGLSEGGAGRAGLAATELATNLLKHGGGGSVLIGSNGGATATLALIATDSGSGIANVSAARVDGYSTAGSPGTGLGALERACSEVDLYTLPQRGTVVACSIADEASRPPAFAEAVRVRIGGLSFPKPGQQEDGDAWTAMVARDETTVAVIDGLGHGPAAATASSAAVRIVAERFGQPLEGLMQDIHGALRATRGAAIGIARIHAAAGRVDFIGCGNIAGMVTADDATRRVVSLPGIVGHEMRKLQAFSYPWTASSVLILHSDGVSGSWNMDQYPGLLQHGPAVIGAVLYRDHCRGSDDATVVVAKAS